MAAVEVQRALAEAPLVAVELVRDDLRRVHDRDAAERVDQLLEPLEVDEHHVVHLDAGEVLDRLDRERRAAVGVCRVDLRRGVAGDLGAQVARDRELRDLLARRVDAKQQDRVGA